MILLVRQQSQLWKMYHSSLPAVYINLGMQVFPDLSQQEKSIYFLIYKMRILIHTSSQVAAGFNKDLKDPGHLPGTLAHTQ